MTANIATQDPRHIAAAMTVFALENPLTRETAQAGARRLLGNEYVTGNPLYTLLMQDESALKSILPLKGDYSPAVECETDDGSQKASATISPSTRAGYMRHVLSQPGLFERMVGAVAHVLEHEQCTPEDFVNDATLWPAYRRQAFAGPEEFVKVQGAILTCTFGENVEPLYIEPDEETLLDLSAQELMVVAARVTLGKMLTPLQEIAEATWEHTLQ